MRCINLQCSSARHRASAGSNKNGFDHPDHPNSDRSRAVVKLWNLAGTVKLSSFLCRASTNAESDLQVLPLRGWADSALQRGAFQSECLAQSKVPTSQKNLACCRPGLRPQSEGPAVLSTPWNCYDTNHTLAGDTKVSM